jgi:predicted ester cyclase/ketosteroid isomerase-like protein
LFKLILIVLAAGCAEVADEGEGNKALILNANDEILNKGNLAFVQDAFSEDYANPAGRGPDTIRKFATSLRTAFPDLDVSVEPIIAEGDMVAWLRTHSGTHQADFLGVPSSGKNVTWQSMVMSRVNDGKIVQEWAVDNLKEQLTVGLAESAGGLTENEAAAVRENLEAFAASDPIKSPDTFFAQFTDDIYWAPGPNFLATNIQELRDGSWCTATSNTQTVDHIEGLGNLAYARGTFQLSLDCGDPQVVERQGSYLSVHRRQSDGTWLIATRVSDG